MADLLELPTRARGKAEAVALTLYDGAQAAHELPGRARQLLQLAAAIYALGERADPGRGDRAGRELALSAALPGLSPERQQIVAAAVALQREKQRPNRESTFVGLSGKHQQVALRLAALLRVARAITAAPADLLVHVHAGATTLVVGAARANRVVKAAQAAAPAWEEAIGPFAARPAEDAELSVMHSLAGPSDAPLDDALDQLLAHVRAPGADLGAEPVAEVARRTLRRFFDKLLAREEAVLRGEDSEDVHQMRVATRRLRAALQNLAGVFEPELIRRYRKGLRQIAEALGGVRDGDVFLEHILAYRESLPAGDQAVLGALVEAVAAERASARARLLGDLSSKRYRKLKREFAAFLSTPGAGALPPPEPGVTERLRDFAGSAIWRRYELWRAYEPELAGAGDTTLHQARIAGKRLRYTLEFFADALGPQVDGALEQLTALQENLGTLQDIVTAHAHVAALGLADDPGAQAYLAGRAAERAPLLADLPERWGAVAGEPFRRRLFELIIGL